jgi:signal transduction histidine kinase
MTNETNQVFELKPVVETAMRFFSHEWKDGVGLEIKVPPGLEMRGDSNHLVQVLINLVQNAIDAMRTKTYPEGEACAITISATEETNVVRLVVRDNGPGVPDDIKDKVFDPFFTTKDVGAGMGLGLAICHRIIAEHGGRVDVRSESGIYSEFILEFPSTNTIFHNTEVTHREDR